MQVYFNGNKLLEFEGTLPVETVRAKVAKAVPSVKNANYTLSADGQKLEFQKEARTLGN